MIVESRLRSLPVAAGGLEVKPRVILGMTQNDDKRATTFPEFLVTCFALLDAESGTSRAYSSRPLCFSPATSVKLTLSR